MNKAVLILAGMTLLTACGGEHKMLIQPPMDVAFDVKPLTFEKDILPIVQVRCTSCHNPNSGLPFWEQYPVIFEKRDRVRQRVFVDRSMPLNNSTGMTDHERQIFADWIDQGAQP